jgi:hypothetical protein
MADDGQVVVTGPWEARVDYEASIFDATPCDVEPTIVKIEPRPTAAHLFVTRLQERADANVQLAIRKNSDYASPDRPYANFEAAPLVGVSVARGMLVRMQDKLQRISNLLDRPARNESIQDSCDDLSMYALILGVYLEQTNGKAE